MRSLFERMAEVQRPVISGEDRVPHDRAVWRAYQPDILAYDGAPAPGVAGHQISIDYGDGQINQSWGHLAQWRGARRWRFGWPPA